ncbi:MAG TPA: hypothetical protein VME18_11485 [Acidobacteriaceae bacterium]|nr:hypothetical protein [Acidobacteriaceae bacterium]
MPFGASVFRGADRCKFERDLRVDCAGFPDIRAGGATIAAGLLVEGATVQGTSEVGIDREGCTPLVVAIAAWRGGPPDGGPPGASRMCSLGAIVPEVCPAFGFGHMPKLV